jgi:hypothetical protein
LEYLESKQERDASVTAEYVKAEVLAKVPFSMSEKDPALRVTKAVADYYSLHRNLRLDFINGKSKEAVEYLVSVIKPVTLKILIESKLDMDKFDLKKDFFEFVTYPEKMAIIHDEHCHVVEHKKTGDSGMKITGKSSDADSRSSGHNSGGGAYRGGSIMASDRDRTKSEKRKVVGLDLHWKAVGTGAAALPQHEEVCGREALLVRLSSNWKGRS